MNSEFVDHCCKPLLNSFDKYSINLLKNVHNVSARSLQHQLTLLLLTDLMNFFFTGRLQAFPVIFYVTRLRFLDPRDSLFELLIPSDITLTFFNSAQHGCVCRAGVTITIVPHSPERPCL